MLSVLFTCGSVAIPRKSVGELNESVGMKRKLEERSVANAVGKWKYSQNCEREGIYSDKYKGGL